MEKTMENEMETGVIGVVCVVGVWVIQGLYWGYTYIYGLYRDNGK